MFIRHNEHNNSKKILSLDTLSASELNSVLGGNSLGSPGWIFPSVPSANSGAGAGMDKICKCECLPNYAGQLMSVLNCND